MHECHGIYHCESYHLQGNVWKRNVVFHACMYRLHFRHDANVHVSQN
uniref:Uncharacterized protein n=1 Tax=Arundo donax TaxID=35708 RepID=A0A0A9HB82_ARUDO